MFSASVICPYYLTVMQQRFSLSPLFKYKTAFMYNRNSDRTFVRSNFFFWKRNQKLCLISLTKRKRIARLISNFDDLLMY